MQHKRIVGGLVAIASVILALLLWPPSNERSNERVSPLMIAAKSGDVATVDQLIEQGTDVDAQSAYGWTALMFAAWQGHQDVVQSLVEAGADKNATSNDVPANFSTTGDYPSTSALFEAISNKHFVIALYLMKSNAVIDAEAIAVAGAKGNINFLAALLENGANFNEVSENQYFRTALSAAARHGNTENLEWLLANGADPTLPLPHSTNLNEAVRDLNPKAVSILLDAGAEVDELIGSRKTTALREAVYAFANDNLEGKVQVVEVLLAHGANPNYVLDSVSGSLNANREILKLLHSYQR